MERLTRKSDSGMTWFIDYEHKDPIEKEPCEMDYRNNRLAIEKLAEYEDLEEQEKLLKLPCAVGDTVYTNIAMQGWYFREKNRPYKAKVVFIGINEGDNFINVDFEFGRMLQFKFSDIGKIVFLTLPEAEQALKKMRKE